jgi:hypothetical protein
MSYDGHEEDRDKVLNALGGKKGLIDSGLPSLVFLVDFNFSHNLNQALISSLILSALFTLLRLIKRETLQHAISGFIGIGICALLSRHTGHAKDFYLPGLWTNVGYAIAYTLTNLIGWPLIGVMLGPILGENFEWRLYPERKAAYRRAGWLWVGLFVSRLVVQYPLYKANQVNWLGTARLAMGYPLFFLVGWWSWLILRKVPVVKAGNN